jgi:hypothetical protein
MCTLRAAGLNFDVDSFLATSPIQACAVYHAGEPKFSTKPDGPRIAKSGFNADVSRRDWADLAGQIEDAKTFLRTLEAELRRITAFPGFESMTIDFPMNLRIGTNNIVVQSDRLPADLLLLAGALGIDIALTIYPPNDDGRADAALGEGTV